MKLREQKGSMAVYVTVVLVGMLFILMAVFFISNSVRRTQLQTNLKVKEAYEADNPRADQIYASLTREEEENPPSTSNTVEEAIGGEAFTATTSLTDDSGDTVWVPGGFAIHEESATDADDGIVITDGTNEFVWIPVPDISTMYIVSEEPIQLSGVDVTTNVYSNLRGITGTTPGGDSGYREPDILTDTSSGDASTTANRGIELVQDVLEITGSSNEEILNNFAQSLVDEYNVTYTSINTYGGFYIGRYELTGNMTTPTVQKNQPVLDASVAGSWYGLKEACGNVVSSDYAQTTMVYGNQWDQVMNFITDPDAEEGKTEAQVNANSNEWGNYRDSTGAAQENSGSTQDSRTNEAWQAKNIYDLAGNYFEWTQEANYTDSRAARGRLL